MADKMLRIGGRSSDAKTRPIRTDQKGNVGTQLTTRNEVATMQTVTVAAGATVHAINRFSNLENYSAVVVAVSLSANIDFKIQGEWHIKEKEVYAGYGVMVHRQDLAELKNNRHSTNYIELKGSQLSILFTNNSTQQVTVDVFLIGIR